MVSVKRVAAVLAATALAFTLGVAPAEAGIFERGDYDDSFTDNTRSCGVKQRIDAHFWGTYTIRDANRTTNGQFFYVHDRVNAHITITNRDTGAYFTESWRTVIREQQARPTDQDGVVTYVTKESGAYWTVTDSEGNVIIQDRGTAKNSYTFDTLNDGVPSGDWVDVGEPTFHGNFSDVDYCELVNELIG